MLRTVASLTERDLRRGLG